MKFSISTLGCKVNNYESEMITEHMINAGFKLVSYEESPDICIINTCTVTNNADSKSMHMLRMLKGINKNAIFVMCGCMVESHKDNIDNIDADIIIGNKDKSKLPTIINEFIKNKEQIIKMYDLKDTPFEDMVINKYSSKTRAFIKIQDGCNNFCSYCIIPYVRGGIRSKDFNTVISEVKELSDRHKEIVLTGIHTGSYNSNNHDLTDLIHELSLIDNIKRIRISSIEITELDDKFLNEFKNNPKICDHLHVPLQSGSDTILKLMNRKYNKEEYENIINKIRSIRESVSITTDLIVGFPGETEELFNETLDFIKKIGFTKVHVFPYSKRKGTPASIMDNQVPDSVKHARAREVIRLSNSLEETYYKKFIGKELDVLIEKSDDISLGHTSNYLYVQVMDRLESNQIYKVLITDVDGLKVIGKKVY